MELRTLDEKVTIAGASVPTFLYGTAWKEAQTEDCVRNALTAGFRGIDTANQRRHYDERGVGKALHSIFERGALVREDLFIQSKFTPRAGQDERLPYDPNADLHTQVLQSFRSSLDHLHTDYLDSLVLHGPTQRSGIGAGDREIWGAMEELHKNGKVKLLGVSNVLLDQLRAFYEEGEVKPAFVQNRCFATTGWDKEVRNFCDQNGIVYQGFSLLTANQSIFGLPRFQELVARYSCTPAQLVFCFALQVRMIPLTGTTNPQHMQEDLEVYRFTLTSEDVALLEDILNDA